MPGGDARADVTAEAGGGGQGATKLERAWAGNAGVEAGEAIGCEHALEIGRGLTGRPVIGRAALEPEQSAQILHDVHVKRLAGRPLAAAAPLTLGEHEVV